MSRSAQSAALRSPEGEPAGSPAQEPAPHPPSLLARIFGVILARRWIVLAIYALLLPPAAWFAARVEQDNSIDRLIVPTDPDAIATREFEKVFGGGEYAVLVAEADDPLAPAVVERIDRIERALAKVPRVEASSPLSIFRRAKAGFEGTPAEMAAFRQFVGGTRMFDEQGLHGDRFLAIALVLDVHDRVARRDTLAAEVGAIDEAGGGSPPLLALRRVGAPYVSVHLDEATRRSGARSLALFAALVVALNLALYRSARALAAFLITLGVSTALSVGYIGLTGGTFSIVSPMVPMTILITATATLVYLHSRFVDRPEGTSLHAHHLFALENKFVACTASIFATLVGFAALAVSDIRPIREMGIWVAVGLLMTWVVVFTLFPVLQHVLRTPTSVERRVAGAWFLRLTEWLPRATYRLRWPLVVGALLLCVAGAIALFGAPGIAAPMRPLVNPIEYVDDRSNVYADTRRIEALLPGVAVTEVWLKGNLGAVSEPDVLVGLDAFQHALQADPEVGAAVGPTTILRMTRYLAGQGDAWPEEPEAVDELAADLEGLVPKEPLLQRFVQRHSLAQTHFAVLTRAVDQEGFDRLDAVIRRHWSEAVAKSPALRVFEMKTVGLSRLQARMSQSLVPTLVESFALTAGVIFVTFLVVFRSGAARIMTMLPSLFAILVMFAFMRGTGMMLNVATILIASTVLGTSENDQIHFFYHFLEKRRAGTVEEALRHTLRVSGRAIFFATLINAGGFLAFAFADLPPMRQFGILSAVALTLSMLADFTALPAALWLVFREKPDALPRAAER